MGMVKRGMIWSPPVTMGVLRTQSNWSVCPLGWQLAHEKVPVVEEDAVSNAMRPRFTNAWVGSSSTMVSTTSGFEVCERSTRETVSAAAFSTQARNGLPSALHSRAMP